MDRRRMCLQMQQRLRANRSCRLRSWQMEHCTRGLALHNRVVHLAGRTALAHVRYII